jgi:hypothetical protein
MHVAIRPVYSIKLLVSSVCFEGDVKGCRSIRRDETATGGPCGSTKQRLGGCKAGEVSEMADTEGQVPERNGKVMGARNSCR